MNFSGSEATSLITQLSSKQQKIGGRCSEALNQKCRKWGSQITLPQPCSIVAERKAPKSLQCAFKPWYRFVKLLLKMLELNSIWCFFFWGEKQIISLFYWQVEAGNLSGGKCQHRKSHKKSSEIANFAEFLQVS